MMSDRAVFVDTSAWIAILHADDLFHEPARRLWEVFESANRELVTTDWIFAETGNGLARLSTRSLVPAAVRTFLQSSGSRLVWIDQDIFNRALALYDQAKDKGWGLVDCSSFVVMRDRRITTAMSTDRHFDQAGFRAVLSSQ